MLFDFSYLKNAVLVIVVVNATLKIALCNLNLALSEVSVCVREHVCAHVLHKWLYLRSLLFSFKIVHIFTGLKFELFEFKFLPFKTTIYFAVIRFIGVHL